MVILAANANADADAATDHPCSSSSDCCSPGDGDAGDVVGERVARGGEHCSAPAPAAAAASPAAPAGRRQRRDAKHAPARGNPPRPQV